MELDIYPVYSKKDDKPPTNSIIWGLIILIIFIVFILTGCRTPKYTEQAAIGEVNKANTAYPAPVAKWLRGNYPCIVLKVKPDSADYLLWKTEAGILKNLYEIEKNKIADPVYIQIDTVDCVQQCNDKLIALKKIVWLKDDYIVKLENKIKFTRPVHDTIPIADSTEMKIMADEIANRVVINFKITQKNEILQQKINNKNKWLLWLLIGFVISTGLHFLKLKFSK